MKNRKRIGFLLGLLILAVCACGRNSDIYLEEYEESTQKTETEELLEVSGDEEESTLCYVYICGAVAKPGVYALPEGSRIYEVIQEAGGLTEDAEDTLVNQAEPVTDGMMIRIYTKDEAEANGVEGSGTAGGSSNGDDRLDINTASVTELMTLPGIGSAKAEAIVAYREEYGKFSSIEDLMKIPGIKEGIFRQMKEHIKVNK